MFGWLILRKDAIQIRREEHENFAHQRCVLYIPQPNYFSIIDDVCKTTQGYLWVVGESGSGKSSLMANWWRRRRESPQQKDEKPIFIHFVGASILASSFPDLIISLFREINICLKQMGESALAIPKEDSLVSSIPNFLEAISQGVCKEECERVRPQD